MAGSSTRRAVLAAGVALPLLVAGCKDAGLTALGPVPSPPPDVELLDHAIAAEQLMVARYESAYNQLGTSSSTPRHGPSRATVGTILADHQAHLARLRARLILPPRLRAAVPRRNPPGSLPTGSHQLFAALAADERAAAQRLLGQLQGAPPALAQLMASISASEAAHAILLGDGGRI